MLLFLGPKFFWRGPYTYLKTALDRQVASSVNHTKTQSLNKEETKYAQRNMRIIDIDVLKFMSFLGPNILRRKKREKDVKSNTIHCHKMLVMELWQIKLSKKVLKISARPSVLSEYTPTLFAHVLK